MARRHAGLVGAERVRRGQRRRAAATHPRQQDEIDVTLGHARRSAAFASFGSPAAYASVSGSSAAQNGRWTIAQCRTIDDVTHRSCLLPGARARRAIGAVGVQLVVASAHVSRRAGGRRSDVGRWRRRSRAAAAPVRPATAPTRKRVAACAERRPRGGAEPGEHEHEWAVGRHRVRFDGRLAVGADRDVGVVERRPHRRPTRANVYVSSPNATPASISSNDGAASRSSSVRSKTGRGANCSRTGRVVWASPPRVDRRDGEAPGAAWRGLAEPVDVAGQVERRRRPAAPAACPSGGARIWSGRSSRRTTTMRSARIGRLGPPAARVGEGGDHLDCASTGAMADRIGVA